MTKTFAGYLHGLFRTVPEARALQPYTLTRTSPYSDIRERVLLDTAKKIITVEREGRLLSWLGELHARWLADGKLVDVRDPRDWKDLGEGARVRVTHRTIGGGRDDA